jgi:hypothetical protein
MKTVPLHGKKAAGRVARVDDEDYDLAMQHRWNVWEPKPGSDRHRQDGPYAMTNITVGGRQQTGIRMHSLITGWPLTDHRDHDGLNNQRYNLRPATPGENARNVRPRLRCTSQYKGVSLTATGLWQAYIDFDGQRRYLGHFVPELEAAYAHDAAARELHREFACPNFSEDPTQAMRDQWRAEREARKALMAADSRERLRAGAAKWWAEREPETCICTWCGKEYQARWPGKKYYCGSKCLQSERTQRRRDKRQEERQRVEEGRLF